MSNVIEVQVLKFLRIYLPDHREILLRHTLWDLGLDSLDLVEIILGLEDTFEIDLPNKDAEKCRTVQDLVNLVRKHWTMGT